MEVMLVMEVVLLEEDGEVLEVMEVMEGTL
jgi:negative regulator of sigma E activity